MESSRNQQPTHGEENSTKLLREEEGFLAFKANNTNSTFIRCSVIFKDTRCGFHFDLIIADGFCVGFCDSYRVGTDRENSFPISRCSQPNKGKTLGVWKLSGPSARTREV